MATLASQTCLLSALLNANPCLQGSSKSRAVSLSQFSSCQIAIPSSHERICKRKSFLSEENGKKSAELAQAGFLRYSQNPWAPCASRLWSHSSPATGRVKFQRRASHLWVGARRGPVPLCAARGGGGSSRDFESSQGGEEDEDAHYRAQYQERQATFDGESGHKNQGHISSRDREFQNGNEAYRPVERKTFGGNGRGRGDRSAFERAPRNFAGDEEGGRYNAPGRNPANSVRDRPAQSERQPHSKGQFRQELEDDDEVQTRSFVKGQPRAGPEAPFEKPAPFRRTLLKKELFEKQGNRLAENLGLDERDVYGWKKDDLRDPDNYDVGKRPDFRDFSQRDIFRDKIGQAPDTHLDRPEIRSRVSAPSRPPPAYIRPERVSPSDFQNEKAKPFQKPKPPGLDVGPTIDKIKPRFYQQDEPPDTNATGWKPDNNRGYRAPYEPSPQQWLRRPPPPASRYKPVASDGEIKFEEDKGGKKKYTGLEQEEDGFWDDEQESGEISFARAALKHDLELDDLEEMQFQVQQEERAEKLRRRRAMYRAETLLDPEELKRLRRDALKQRWFIKIGKTGATNAVLNEIFKVWNNLEVAKLKVREGALIGQMRHLHNTLEEKTGGLVILRTGTLIHLYRGPDYKGPPPRPKVNDITEAIGDQDLFGEDDDLEEGDLMQQFEVEDGISSVAQFLLKDPTEDVSKFSRKLALMSGGEKGQVRKRLTEKPVRWLPPGQSAKLTNFEMMMLRRKGKRIKPAFVLGQQRRFDGIAAAIMEYWERNEIVKISCRAVINANLEKTAKGIQDLVGGVLLVKEGGLISLYRGKDYLPLRIGEALRRYQQRMIAEKEAERAQENAEGDAEGSRETEESGGESSKWVAEAGVPEQEFEQELEADEKAARRELEKAGEREALETRSEEGSLGSSDGADVASDSVRSESRGVGASVGVPNEEELSGAEASVEEPSTAEETSIAENSLTEGPGQEKTSEAHTASEETHASASQEETGQVAEESTSNSDKSESADSSDDAKAAADAPEKPIKLVKDLVVIEDEVPQARVDQMLEAVAAYRRRDIETLTPEERAALRKKGLGERRFLQVGRRGVFAGTIQNIHLHWKRHELCKIRCTGIRPEIVPIVAEQLAVESGGVLVDYVGTTILLYRGKNYIAPETIVPVHMLNKQEALRRAKAEQRAQSLLELEIQRQEELAKQRKRLEYSLKLEQQPPEKEAPKKRPERPLAPGVREFVVIPEAVELNTNVEAELRKTGPLIPKEHNQPDLPAFWRAPDMSPVQKKKIAKMSKQERTNAFLVGKRGITEGLGLTIRQHFYRHAFAKVSLKQRPNGITVKECMIELERLTGGVCVAKEPTRVIIYRGWEPGTDPPWIKKDPKTGEVLMPRRPLIAQALQETDSIENTGDLNPTGTNVFGEKDDFTRGSDADWRSDEEDGEEFEEGGEENGASSSYEFDDDVISAWGDGSEEDYESDEGGSGSSDQGSELPPVLYADSSGIGHSSVEARA